MERAGSHYIDRLVRRSLDGGIPLFLFLAAIIAGFIALQFTPREEEPQIVVPMLDVLVSAPGLSARQVERQVTIPVEKLLTQIPGVEHVYSTSKSGQAAVTLRFYVGQDREESILNTYNKLHSNQDQVPGVVSEWLLRPVEVDDVPIVLLALWSEDSSLYDDHELRRIADEVTTQLQSIPQTSEVKVAGGRPRAIRVLLDPESLAARKTTALEVAQALTLSNQLQSAGIWTYGNETILLESGDFIRSEEELERLLVNVIDGTPVYLQDVATIIDGPGEAENYSWIEFAPGHPRFSPAQEDYPMVTISVAKHRGSNAVSVAREIHDRMSAMQETILPPEVQVEVLRDYGQTANEKVNNLSSSLAFAIMTVVVFIGVFLGIREALVVGLAVPICYGITLALDLAFGYTINRVTLFALILSLGLLVDDPITGVDNIERYIKRKGSGMRQQIVAAMAEIRTPLMMSTVTIMLAFVPLGFITGMMGPYMAPMAFNVPVSVAASTLVAFLVTPWLASRLLKPSSLTANKPEDEAAPLFRFYSRMLLPVLDSRKRAHLVLWGVLGLFFIAASLPLFRLVPLKLLPYDNKNEIQIVIDMPEYSSLESTAALAKQVSKLAGRLPEIQAIAVFVGTPSPIDFNGMVRRYYQRMGPHMADLRLTLVDKDDREHQSHAVVLRLRELLIGLNAGDASIKVVEVPPGPPVLSTLVAEIQAGALVSYEEQRRAAGLVMDRLGREPQVVEIDSTVEHSQRRLRFIADKQKAALSGVSTEDVTATLSLANQGLMAGYVQLPRETRPLPIELRLAANERTSTSDFMRLRVKGRPGIVQESSPQGLDSAARPLVSIGELGSFEPQLADKAIHRKDLRPVVYVTAEISGRTPAEVIADVQADLGPDQPRSDTPVTDWESRQFIVPGGGDGWQLPDGVEVLWTGEGEWRITVRVFRDMGLAFAFALIAIFFVLHLQTASTALSMIIMSSIPLTIIGIMPGFWLMNQFGERLIAGAPDPVMFTATAMIGMIALAGIVVRNSLILVEFITQSRESGLPLKEALIQAGAVRMRPVLLTAGTTMLGNLIITLDPVFSGLALAIIFGIVASTLFTLLVVPVVYLLVFDQPEKAQVND
jgi:multidrug efflux pump subunit AcrB